MSNQLLVRRDDTRRASCLAFVALVATAFATRVGWAASYFPRPAQGEWHLQSHLLSPKQIYHRVAPVVVRIDVKANDGKSYSGSGFFFRDRTHVATCFHVLDQAVDIRIHDSKGKTYSPIGLRFDKAADLALIEVSPRCEAQPLAPASFGTLSVGDELVVIGDPLGLENSLATGVVSGKRKSGTTRLVQFTAALSHGNSGSPVIDQHGSVVAIAQATLESGQLINFGPSTDELTGLALRKQLGVRDFEASNQPANVYDAIARGLVTTPSAPATLDPMPAPRSIADLVDSIALAADNLRCFQLDRDDRFITGLDLDQACATFFSISPDPTTSFGKWGSQFSAEVHGYQSVVHDYLEIVARDQDDANAANISQSQFLLNIFKFEAKDYGRVGAAYMALLGCLQTGPRSILGALSPAAHYLMIGPVLVSPAAREDIRWRLIEPDPGLPYLMLIAHDVHTPEDSARNEEIAKGDRPKVPGRFDPDNSPHFVASIEKGDSVFAVRAVGKTSWTLTPDWKRLSEALDSLRHGAITTVEALIGREYESAKTYEMLAW
jgi:hypothetical protein